MYHKVYQSAYHDAADRAVGDKLKAPQAEGSQEFQEEVCQIESRSHLVKH